MITHKEVIEIIKEVTLPIKYIGKRIDILELLESEMWHDYLKERPPYKGEYLCRMADETYKILFFLEGGAGNPDDDNYCPEAFLDDKGDVVSRRLIIAWTNIPKYEGE